MKLTIKEKDFLIALLTIVQTEFDSDRAIGMRVDKKEEAMVNKILATLKEDEVEAQLKHWGYRKGIQQTAVKAEGSALNLDKLSGS